MREVGLYSAFFISLNIARTSGSGTRSTYTRYVMFISHLDFLLFTIKPKNSDYLSGFSLNFSLGTSLNDFTIPRFKERILQNYFRRSYSFGSALLYFPPSNRVRDSQSQECIYTVSIDRLSDFAISIQGLLVFCQQK